MSNQELKPCPFCNKLDITTRKGARTQMMCIRCGAEGPDAATRAEAVALWNTRPVEDAWRARAEAAEALFNEYMLLTLGEAIGVEPKKQRERRLEIVDAWLAANTPQEAQSE